MDAWWSEAIQLQFASQNGGAYSGGPFRGVIHTTEVKSYTPSTKSYYGHHNPPHFTMVIGKSDEVKFYQHFPITVAARAGKSQGRRRDKPALCDPNRDRLESRGNRQAAASDGREALGLDAVG
jgi:hypothetical protein